MDLYVYNAPNLFLIVKLVVVNQLVQLAIQLLTKLVTLVSAALV